MDSANISVVSAMPLITDHLSKTDKARQTDASKKP
jgi:hypothetical protein